MQQSPGEVVENDYVAAAQGRDQLGFDVAVEEFAVDPSPWSLGPVAFPWLDIDDPRRVEPVVPEGGWLHRLGLSHKKNAARQRDQAA